MNRMRIAIVSVAAALVATGCASPPATPQARWSPLQAEAMYRLGRWLQGQQRLTEALAAYQEALAAEPGHAAALNAAGTVHSQLGQAGDAEAAFRAAIARDPDSPLAHNNLGYHLLNTGRAAEALPLLERAVALSPSDAVARSNLTLAQAALQPAPAVAVAAAAAPPPGAAAPTLKLQPVAPGVWELRNVPAPAKPAVAAAANAATASAPPALSAGLRMEVANGNGATGLARRVAAMLGLAAPQRRLTNDKPFGVRNSRIEHVRAAEPDARALQQRLPIDVPLVPVTALERGAGVRLVLGKDFPREPVSPSSIH